MISKGELHELNALLKLTRACGKHMRDNGIDQWDENYPNLEIFKEDVKNKSLFVIEDNELVLGCICISLKIDDVYKDVKWLTPNSNNVYLHRLAIHPNFQGQGLALKLMEYAEDFTIKNGCVSIRLDTFSQNKRNQKFYELRGYKKLGDIYFPKQSEYPFHCYELVL